MANVPMKSLKLPGLSDLYTFLQNDTNLAVTGKAADAKKTGDAIAPEYNGNSTYAVGEYVRYNGVVYKCNTAISTAEAWTAAHWTATNVAGGLHADVTDVKSATKSNIESVYNGNCKSMMRGTQPVLVGNYSVGQTVDISPILSSGSSHYTALIGGIMAGESFTVTLADGNTARPWAFLDADYKLLSMASGAIVSNVTITAPTNTAYLLLQSATEYYSNAIVIRHLALKNCANQATMDQALAEINGIKNDINEIVSIAVSDLGLIVGGMDTNGTYQSNQKYRVVTENKVLFPIDVIIRLTSTNYRIYVIVYKNDGTIASRHGWSAYAAPFVIKSGTQFKCMISRTTEDTTETNNLAEFSAVTNIAALKDATNAMIDNAIYDGNYVPMLRMTDAVLLGNYSVGQTVDISAINTIGFSHATLLIDNISADERFIVTLTDGSTARPWAFLDADYKLLSMASDAAVTNQELTAPTNAKYLLLQVGMANYSAAKISRVYNLANKSSLNDLGIVSLNGEAELTEKLIEMRYCGNNSKKNFTLFHFSDIHGDTVNISRILNLKTAFPEYVDDIIHSGDSVATYFGNDNPFSSVGGAQVLNLIGNHDCWIQGDTWPSPYNATAQQTYEKFIAPFISNWSVTSPGTNLCYYYKDYSDYGIRLICLDCMHYDATQESWFIESMTGAKANDYSVIVVNHYPPQTGITAINCTFTSYGETIGAVTTPEAGTQIERLPESAYTAVDTFISGGGKFVCWLAGHTHFDFVGTVTDHTNQLFVIVNCGVVDARYGTDKRINGTKTQDCVNVVGFDTTNHIVKICRVGIAMDWFGRTKKLLSIDYANKTVVANT